MRIHDTIQCPIIGCNSKLKITVERTNVETMRPENRMSLSRANFHLRRVHGLVTREHHRRFAQLIELAHQNYTQAEVYYKSRCRKAKIDHEHWMAAKLLLDLRKADMHQNNNEERKEDCSPNKLTIRFCFKTGDGI